MKSSSEFIAKASAEVAEELIQQGEAAADQLLADAREHIYHWPQSFPGFAADLSFIDGTSTHCGALHSPDCRSMKVSWESAFDSRWVRYQLEELISHRESPEKSKMASKTGCKLGDDHPVYGTKITFIGDKMESFYRLKDRKICQIGRSYTGTSFIINIDEHQNFGTADEPRYAATHYTAFYWTKENGQLVKTETYLDSYLSVDGTPLPNCRRISIAESAPKSLLRNCELRFMSHQILD